MPIPTYEQIKGKAAVWLLELDLGGDVRRYARQEVVTTDGAVYRSGLEIETVTLDEGLDRVSITIQDPAEDWARYENRGGILDMQIGTLRLWWPGMSEAQSYGVLKGRTSGARTGTPGQPGRLSLSLRAGELAPSVLYPPTQAQIDRSTFTWNPGTVRFADEAEGFAYPVIVGYPGSGDEDDNNPPAVVEVPFVTITTGTSADQFVMIALGEIDAAQIQLTDLGGSQTGFVTLKPEEALATETASDLIGQGYTRVELSSLFADPGINSTAVVGPLACSFRNTSGWGGGALNRTRSGPLRGLGEVISWCLEKSGVHFDRARQDAERARLDAFKLDGLIAGGVLGRVDLDRFVADDLAKLFPIRRMQSADGVWWRYFSFDPSPADATAYLSADTGEIQRTGDLQRTHGKYNVFTLRFRVNSQRASTVRVLAPDHHQLEPYTGVDERIIGSQRCRASEALYGRREAPEVETPLVWSYKTASTILREWAARDALPYRAVSYEGTALEWLTPGDVIAITDTEIGFAERLAIVDSVTIGGSAPTLGLVIPYSAKVLTA